jgi:lipopolysaccharide biosynthesis protein
MEIFEAFKRSNDLALVAPEGHILSMDTYWGSNADSVRYLCRRMGVAGPDVGCSFFPAGSMFFVRLDALRPLLDAHIGEHEFEGESGQVDGTLAHAIERIFGVLANHAGRFMAAGDAPDVAYTSGAQVYPFAEVAEE